MCKKFNITYETSTISVGSAIVEAVDISKALADFELKEKVLAIVEINIKSNVKPITMLANIEKGTLLRNGKCEKIVEVLENSIVSESGEYLKSDIKCTQS